MTEIRMPTPVAGRLPSPARSRTDPGKAPDRDAIEDCMRRGLDGDRAAYDAALRGIGRSMRPYVQAVLSRARRSMSEADDIIQEVLIAVHAARGRWRRSDPLFAWVQRIARNKVVDHLRREAGPLRIGVALAAHAPIELPPSGRLEPLDARRLIADLPPRQREAVCAIVLRGHDSREAAAMLGVTDGAVRIALHRGLHRLRDEIRTLERCD